MVIEGDTRLSPLSPDFFKVLLDKNYKVPSKYLSTKSIEETVQEIYYSLSHLDVRFASPVLSDIRNIKGELEILYTAVIPEGLSGLKDGFFIPQDQLELESFYEQALIRQPRSVSQRF